MKNLQESPVLGEPEPLLARFLEKYVLEGASIDGDEIRTWGATPQNKPFKKVTRYVTPDEFDQADAWIRKAPEILERIPVVNINMEILRHVRVKMPLSPKPLL